MPATAGKRLAELLGGKSGQAAASVYRKLAMTDLSIEVAGVGALRFPVSTEQVAQLREVGLVARFGRGTQTLTDPEVRDTWEIPKELLSIEWTERFGSILTVMRDEMGLPSHCELTAELHSMLLYEIGQFFVTHQDSEKDDAMIATLVVTLPSGYTGGELVIEHGGRRVEYKGSKVALPLVAFYADCHHQVLPVKTGHRITLTYNLLLTGESSAPADDALAGPLAACLAEHFTTPIAPSYGRAPAKPPARLAYLLDHEYTARGLSWGRLKGSDAGRAALLRAAAERADCEITLALAEIQETWDAYEDDDDWYSHDEEEDEGEGEYTLQDLIDSSIKLSHWLTPAGRLEEITLGLGEEEVAASTPSADLEPYASDYEGYMGNYGNTLDRWYRRAAVVIWPRSLDFASRAEASPGWALDELTAMVEAGQVNEAREAAQSLEPFWTGSTQNAGTVLKVANGLDNPQVAALLLRPLKLEWLTPGHGPALAELVTRYGEAWLTSLLADWSREWRPHSYGSDQERLDWLTGLPALGRALPAEIFQRILKVAWTWQSEQVRALLAVPSPSRRQEWLAEYGAPVAAVIEAAAGCGASALVQEVVAACRTDRDQVLALAALKAAGPGMAEFGPLATSCAAVLRARLTRPLRAPDDWSIELPAGCACELCSTLGAFLRAGGRRALEWPLVKDGRRHVHSRIDSAELPVTHQTRRQGRPYTLVLTKTQALFDHEREARGRDEHELARLTENWL
ncbi:2OG-Fe(II) oxygenase [Nonomuraea sp. NPDC026600]|uniref:2OG-Fe(II) oxygenase n=1 Tax=Nonomuraea sp. NPDC026600 TaxID=3155363 RepID=UPI0033C7CBC3